MVILVKWINHYYSVFINQLGFCIALWPLFLRGAFRLSFYSHMVISSLAILYFYHGYYKPRILRWDYHHYVFLYRSNHKPHYFTWSLAVIIVIHVRLSPLSFFKYFYRDYYKSRIDIGIIAIIVVIINWIILCGTLAVINIIACRIIAIIILYFLL